MDPDANLKEQREIMARMNRPENEGGYTGYSRDVARIAELAQALDEWIVKGGALPQRWATVLREERDAARNRVRFLESVLLASQRDLSRARELLADTTERIAEELKS